MKEFIVVVFADEAQAHAGSLALREMHDADTIKLHSVGIAGRDADGNLAVKDAVGKGAPNALAGAAIGGLIGLLGGPVGAIAGAAGGAWIGTWRDMARLGIGAELLEQVSLELAPGKSAVIAEVEPSAPVAEQMRALGGRTFRQRSSAVADAQAALADERADAARAGEPLPGDERRPELVAGRPAKSAHP
jgi:uncharacterized membrane protein